MPSRLIRKLEAFVPLTEAEKTLVSDVERNVRTVAPKTDLITEGDSPENVLLIVEGFACRYKITSEGQRQIMAYLVPGDFCDLHIFILKEMDHSISTLSACKVVEIPRKRVLEMLKTPALATALWSATLVDEATLREWLVNIGTREAPQRIGHLLCELLLRLHVVGLVSEGRFELPITQAEIADTMGLSAIHANRSIQVLREADLITLARGHVVILDFKRLAAFSGFNPNYLHLRNQAEAGIGAIPQNAAISF
ncbi:transcriptional activatory protein AadR [Variibacter gotjawalensis]|uniref:Transcriptional activatory protein AadR n=1 Tax=Variibacter gotjawalensis TaxID=1333996 RepID=A0A0S3Q143_9BRAD|nr:Crp/Fnr family transcriptional regulator [Variibacter gotjawalensis]NIK47713.1 CRP-like cAMP-binding protein [Variibacter gotjawalensis]RZS49607.1 CRP-like cAMP-binding protein [Variibacter gotjawalensis]BAT61870.1 transcriptional activatory protein AadR [Variibacter gotjawalensis]